MSSTYSTESPLSSSSSIFPGWSEHVLRKKYRDPGKLKESLDAIYGSSQYRVIVKADRWILVLPSPLGAKELEDLEDNIRNHY
ncbi:uncharacterized protein BDR25DRAFT_294748 [Lindgomyces ingoldianus]|uniref:Uncharacterized protein n=1 Tax=Lindgomyces ingoldianus TaxID=673940 RepID=A0ACB6QFF2_9PLEO|nr:uncharacterized protein BDR25DRAFT_294748 [Lindgomyces ingoldianus]KAF2465718.1 hypothetical protein BDR25DRAFT_294748 [Lindgomyces ingoldianus]